MAAIVLSMIPRMGVSPSLARQIAFAVAAQDSTYKTPCLHCTKAQLVREELPVV